MLIWVEYKSAQNHIQIMTNVLNGNSLLKVSSHTAEWGNTMHFCFPTLKTCTTPFL